MIEATHISKTYGKQIAVHDLTLTIPRGTVFGFLGQNGAGKTTTMKMLVGLTVPTSGSITVSGKPVAEPSTRRSMGFMPEAPYFYDRLTGLEFLRFCGELCSVKDGEKRYEQLLQRVGIFDARNRPIATYSKGMKQRLAFAQALTNDPEYLFLDEPLDGLEPIGRKEIKGNIKELKARKKTIFFNSHILYDTEELCDSIGVIHEGRLLYTGTVREFCAGESLENQFVKLVEAQRT
jgi:ABC-2 type transport system ATP-binding protein